MTVSSTTNKVSYCCNGSQTVFAYNFKVFEESDLKVILRDSFGGETELVCDSDYTVSGIGDEKGGSITTGEAYASGNTLVIIRELALKQETEYSEGGSFPAKSHENVADRLTMMVQQLEEALKRAIKLSKSSSYSGPDVPEPEAGKALLWNEAGTALVNAFVDKAVGSVLDCTDTPSSYSGQGGKVLKIKSAEDGLEFGEAGGGSAHAVSRGLGLIYVSASQVIVQAGSLTHGLSTAIEKTANKTLDVTDDNDWIGGSAYVHSAYGFNHVYCDRNGNIKLNENPPDHADDAGNTEGTKLYYKDASDNFWRHIGVIPMNASNQVIEFFNYGSEYYTARWDAVNDTSPPTGYTNVDVSDRCPAGVASHLLGVWNTRAAGTTATAFYVRANGFSSGDLFYWLNYDINTEWSVSPVNLKIPLDENAIFQYHCNVASVSNNELKAYGFVINTR